MLVPSYTSDDLRLKYAEDIGLSGAPEDPRDVPPPEPSGAPGPEPAAAAPPEVPGEPPEPTAREKLTEACTTLLNFFKKINYFAQEVAFKINAAQNKMNNAMSVVQNFSVKVPEMPKTPKFGDAFSELSAACPFMISILPKDNFANFIDAQLKSLTDGLSASLNGLIDSARNSKAFKRLTDAVAKVNKFANTAKGQIYAFIQMMDAIVKCLQAICKTIETSALEEHLKKWKTWATGTTEGGVKDSFIGKWASDFQNQNASQMDAFKQFSKPLPKWQSPEPEVYPGLLN